MTNADEAAKVAERVARDSYGRLVAFLAARTRDVAGAEDALGDAFAAALRVWPTDGVPANPNAWLLTVARRKQTDAIRRGRTRDESDEEVQAHLRLIADEVEAAANDPDDIPDRRLALMFACAHPAIDPGIRAALMLQTILGFTADDIAAAFLVSPAAMGQRLARAKTRIRVAGIPFRIPERDELADRLPAVLDAIYAAYSKGWNDIGEAGASDIADQAMWLDRLVVSLLPEEPEAKGLLALMLYTHARRLARRSAAGAYVPLEEQDTTCWDASQLAEAELLLRAASRAGPSGRYQIEAAIQSAHTARRMTGVDNWSMIVQLYDHLLTWIDSPVVVLNRAAALAEAEGVQTALNGAFERLAADKRMLSYQPYWAVRAQLLVRAGRPGEAREAYIVAIGLTIDGAVRTYLQGKLDALDREEGLK